MLDVYAGLGRNQDDVVSVGPRVPDDPLPQLPLTLPQQLLFNRQVFGLRLDGRLDNTRFTSPGVERVELSNRTPIRAVQVRQQSIVGTERKRDGRGHPRWGNLAISSIGILADWSGGMYPCLIPMTVGLRAI